MTSMGWVTFSSDGIFITADRHGGVQDCAPLVLTSPNGQSWEFGGIDRVVKGVVEAESVLVPPDSFGTGGTS